MNEEVVKLHKKQTKMLKIFIKICEENKLKYFLLGGSALGAVRHKGIIPWDDDIDVGMPRRDYNKFMEIAQEKLPKHIFLQNPYTEENYNLIFAKLRDSKTTFIEKNNIDLDINHGVFLDIFPLDGIGKDLENVNKTFYKYRVLREKFRYKLGQHKINNFRDKVRHVYYVLITTYDNVFKGIKTANDYARAIDKFCSEIDLKDSLYLANFGGVYAEKEIFKKSIFGNGTKLKFEGMNVIVPKKTDLYLKGLYGDYMELPPIEKRVAPHFYILDLEKSYKDYLKKDQ